MTINIKGPELRELKPRILVLGVGGAGGNALNGMIEAGMEGVEFVAANTDAQDLINNKADGKIQLGANLTKGLGAGAKHEIGQAAAEESLNDIVDYIKGSNMVFITAGMGGGTGTGASHVIARAAKELNILTVGVVTLPFSLEGPKKMRIALQGLEELIIPGFNLTSGIHFLLTGGGSDISNIEKYFINFFGSNIKILNKNTLEKDKVLEKNFASCLGALKIIKDGWETEAIPEISDKNIEKISFFAKIFKINK